MGARPGLIDDFVGAPWTAAAGARSGSQSSVKETTSRVGVGVGVGVPIGRDARVSLRGKRIK